MESSDPIQTRSEERKGETSSGDGLTGLAGRVPAWASVAMVAVALAPIIVATFRAIRSGWLPIGDNAFFGILARDVLTSNPPLLGTWTSASLTVGRNINNPGPLLVDLLAVPVRLFGTAGGLAFGVALINCAAVIGIALVAHRRGGPLLVAPAMLVTTVLAWAMGSELMFDPWQPHVLLLAFLCFLMLAWTTSCGDLWALPWLVFLASLLLQTHLTYVYLVLAISLCAVIGMGFAMRRALKDGGDDPVESERRLVSVVLVSILVLVVSWAQPVFEQVTSKSTGNLMRLVQTLDDPAGVTVGFRRAPRLMAAVLSESPFWLRPSFYEAFPNPTGAPVAGGEAIGTDHLASITTSLVTLGILVALLLLVAWGGRRREETDLGRAVVVALVAMGAGLYTTARIPIAVFGIAPHQFRWLWPLGAFTGFVLLIGISRVAIAWAARRGGRIDTRVVTAVLAGLMLVVAVANLPKTPSKSGSAYDAWAIPVMQDIDPQMGSLSGKGPLLYDFRNMVFAEPYSTPIMAELQRRGIEFVVDEPGLARQLGPHRRFNGDNAKQRIFYRVGDAALEPIAGAELVAFHAGLTRREEDELAALKYELGAHITEGRLRLTRKGVNWIEGGLVPLLVRDGDVVASNDLAGLFKTRTLSVAVDLGLVEPVPGWRARFNRYGQLQRRQDRETLAVFVAPLDAGSAAR